MGITVEMFSTILIVLGLSVDVIGASILIKASNKTLNFILRQMNRFVDDEFESKIDEVSKTEKNYTSLGWKILVAGFLIHALGYAFPYAYKIYNP